MELQINMGLSETNALHLSHHLRTQDNHLHLQEQLNQGKSCLQQDKRASSPAKAFFFSSLAFYCFSQRPFWN